MSATPSKANDELGLTEKIGYGAGDFASNLYFQFFNLFLLYYYTDVFGLARIFHRSIILAVCHWMVLRGGDFGVFFARGA